MKQIKYIALVVVMVLGSCTKDFEEINTNPDVPTVSDPATLLPSAIFDPINPHMLLQTWLTDQIMQYYVRRNDNQLDAYDFASGQAFFDDVWRANYAAIWDINDIITAGNSEGLDAYVAAAKILKAYYMAVNTELWIDAPASEAGLGSENVSPAYDAQMAIYTSVLQELEEANSLLTSNVAFVRDGDILFNGDVERWKKMANSLRLRYLLRVSNRAEINAGQQINEIVSDPDTYPIITSNDEAAFYSFDGVSPDVSSFALLGIETFSGISMSKRIQDTYEVYDDPRVDFFFRLPQNTDEFPNQEGVPNGLTREAAQSWNGNGDTNTSLLTTVFVEQPALLDYTFIGFAEVQFILAEAALNGWITEGTAEAYYNQGITANFEQWDIAMPEDFLALPEVAWDNTMVRLMDQKWFAYFFNNTVEAWGEKKRTDLPAFEIGPLATSMTNGVFPTRVFYPTLEQSVNATNYEAATTSIGGDIITAPHWYQN